jgi:alkaline phosphatase
MLGDGVGISQISGGHYHFNKSMAVEKMPFVGLQKTNTKYSINADPAAASTAIACGVKSFDGAIGLSSDSLPIASILAMCADKKMKTGVITTAALTHSTVAAFWAHTADSQDDEMIAAQLSKSSLDLAIGGGEKYFNQRKDGINLLEPLVSKGFQIRRISGNEGIFDAADPTKKYLAFTASDDPSSSLEGRTYLPFATTFSLDFLNTRDKENQGFFLVVNGAQIAWGAARNNPDEMLSEYDDFNRAIEKALSFAEKDKETIVIVTSGYEMGGYAVNPGSKPEKLQHEFTGKTVTGTLVPVFSYGPGASIFTGFFENIDFFQKFKNLFNWH